MRAAPLLLLAGLSAAALALAACESTQETSERLSKNAKDLVNADGVKITRRNPDVVVVSKGVVSDENGVAAVVRLRNKGATQAKVPVVITLSDAKGRKLYSNTIPGLDASLTSVAVLERGSETYWVNNQIQTAKPPTKVRAEVGAAPAAKGAAPRISIGPTRYASDVSGLYATATIRNASKVPQKLLIVSCVSRRGGRIVAAGRAIVEKLNPAPTPKPVTFRVYFIGNPKRGTLSCDAPPTVLSGGR